MKKMILCVAILCTVLLMVPGCADKVQIVTTTIGEHDYPSVTVKKGIPVQWTIHVDEGVLNNCNGEIHIPDLGITKKLEVGDNLIEFTPATSGTIPYSCWMDMIQSEIIVED